MNTSTIDTEEHYPRCYKVNDAKIFKSLVVSFYALRSKQIICILQKIGSHLTGTFKNHIDLVVSIVGPD